MDSKTIVARIHTITKEIARRPFGRASLRDYEACYVNPVRPLRAFINLWPVDAPLTYYDWDEHAKDARDWCMGSLRPGWRVRYELIEPMRRLNWLKRRADHLRFLGHEGLYSVIEPSYSMRVYEPLYFARVSGLDIGLPFDEFKELNVRIRRHLFDCAREESSMPTGF